MDKKQGMTGKNKIRINLEDISKATPYKVPENYFDNFTIRMADKISQVEDEKVIKPVFGWLRPQYTAIALTSLALLFSFSIYFLNHGNNFKKLTANEVAHNIEYSIINDTDESELVGQLETIEKNAALPVNTLNKSKQEYADQVIEYLSKDEDIDLNTIVDAL